MLRVLISCFLFFIACKPNAFKPLNTSENAPNIEQAVLTEGELVTLSLEGGGGSIPQDGYLVAVDTAFITNADEFQQYVVDDTIFLLVDKAEIDDGLKLTGKLPKITIFEDISTASNSAKHTLQVGTQTIKIPGKGDQVENLTEKTSKQFKESKEGFSDSVIQDFEGRLAGVTTIHAGKKTEILARNWKGEDANPTNFLAILARETQSGGNGIRETNLKLAMAYSTQEFDASILNYLNTKLRGNNRWTSDRENVGLDFIYDASKNSLKVEKRVSYRGFSAAGKPIGKTYNSVRSAVFPLDVPLGKINAEALITAQVSKGIILPKIRKIFDRVLAAFKAKTKGQPATELKQLPSKGEVVNPSDTRRTSTSTISII